MNDAQRYLRLRFAVIAITIYEIEIFFADASVALNPAGASIGVAYCPQFKQVLVGVALGAEYGYC